MQRLTWATLVLASVAGLLGGVGASAAAERNIVLVVTDDQSPDFGAYGNPVMKTPHLNALAADGTLFRNAFCTTASCSASRSVILTGLHNHANGHYGHQHAYHKFNSYSNIISLPRYLAAAGYRTARCGKYHVAPSEVYPFDEVIRHSGGRNTVAMAKACREFLRASSDQPFFLYWCTSDPHRGGGVRSDLPGAPNAFGNRSDFQDVESVTFRPDEVIVPGFLPDTPECRAELAQYYESVARVDQGVGQLVSELRDAGVWDTTLLVFISDHGIAMPGAKTTLYDGGMRSPLVVRNPYRNDRGNEQSAMVSWVDLTPTLLDFAGALERDSGRAKQNLVQAATTDVPPGSQQTRKPEPGKFHGRSFLDLLDGAPRDEWQTVYASHTFHEITMYYPMRVVREDRFKLIWNIAHPLPFPFASDLWVAPTWQAQLAKGPAAPYGQQTVGSYMHRPQFELFDTVADPYEGRNLADDPSHAETLQRLKTKLKQFQRNTNDPWILKWNYE